ncbi:MAG: Flp pilus assembly protein CpaB [Bradyrhizobium sp.]|nr:MAG: Flp pilus assembly protein CpaB [Bradyrhizobium sp.]
MNKVQIAVLGATVVAFGGAYVLFNSAPAPAPQRVVQAPKLDADEVLIAANDIPMGTALTETLVAWVPWPKAAISPDYMIVKSSSPNVMDDVKGSMAREAFIHGDPIRRDKLVKGNNSGFMSAILPAGMRAVAIKVDNSGEDNAGGFILPNDRVDVIKIYRDDQATKEHGVEVDGAQTILANVRVLAIGQNIQEENGKKVIQGANATLELDPQQAELVILAQHAGNSNLHLALRSLADSAGPAQTVGDMGDAGRGNLTIVRFGAPQTAAR